VVGIIVIKRRPEHDQQQYVFPSKKKTLCNQREFSVRRYKFRGCIRC